MNVLVLLNLSNELGGKDEMRGRRSFYRYLQ